MLLRRTFSSKGGVLQMDRIITRVNRAADDAPDDELTE